MFYNICYYFLIFFGYSVLGWCVETIAVSFIKKKMIWKKSLKKYTKITVKHNSSLFIWYNIDKKNGDKLC